MPGGAAYGWARTQLERGLRWMLHRTASVPGRAGMWTAVLETRWTRIPEVP